MVILWLAAVSLWGAALTERHPMHTSVAELREVAGSIVVSIRVFPDDLETAVPGVGAASGDSALEAYLERTFSISDRNGRAIRLRWKGVERAGDVLRLQLEGERGFGLAGAAVSHGLLLERFRDQVNVLRATYGGRTATLLFLHGDAAKRLP